MTWFAILCQLLVALVSGGLAMRAGVVIIPDSPADLGIEADGGPNV